MPSLQAMSFDHFLRSNHPVQLCAELPVDRKTEVEELLFFNPQQAAMENEILAAIRAFGVPRVVAKGGKLSIEAGNDLVLGTLFAQVASKDGMELAGVLLFLRKGAGMLCLHLSVNEAYSFWGPRGDLCTPAHLLDGARIIGTRIAGVDHLEVYYKRTGWQKIPMTVRLV
mgnify:FL=1